MSNKIDEEMTFTPLNPMLALPAEYIPQVLYKFLEEEDLTGFLCAIQNLIQGYGARLISEKTGLSRENLYKILRGDRTPSLQTVHKIIWAFKSGAISDHRATLSK